MNPAIFAVAFALGLVYGRMVTMPKIVPLALFGLLMAVLLGNYPYYEYQSVAITFASALFGAAVGARRGG
jgi:hypothetical protein